MHRLLSFVFNWVTYHALTGSTSYGKLSTMGAVVLQAASPQETAGGDDSHCRSKRLCGLAHPTNRKWVSSSQL